MRRPHSDTSNMWLCCIWKREVLNKLFSLFFINMILSLIKRCLISDTRVLGSLLKDNWSHNSLLLGKSEIMTNQVRSNPSKSRIPESHSDQYFHLIITKTFCMYYIKEIKSTIVCENHSKPLVMTLVIPAKRFRTSRDLRAKTQLRATSKILGFRWPSSYCIKLIPY